jgi:S1-C subfamily serine protease
VQPYGSVPYVQDGGNGKRGIGGTIAIVLSAILSIMCLSLIGGSIWGRGSSMDGNEYGIGTVMAYDDMDYIWDDSELGSVISNEPGGTPEGIAAIRESTYIPPDPASIANASDATVAILAYNASMSVSLGTGFCIDEAKNIITCEHVVASPDVLYFTIIDNYGNEIAAELVGADHSEDVAVVRPKNPDELSVTSIVIDEAATPFIGECIVAIGNPGQLGEVLTEGQITETGVDASTGDDVLYRNMIISSTEIHQGCSGGPMVDSGDGHLVGMNCLVDENGFEYNGLVTHSVTKPASDVLSVARSLIGG